MNTRKTAPLSFFILLLTLVSMACGGIVSQPTPARANGHARPNRHKNRNADQHPPSIADAKTHKNAQPGGDPKIRSVQCRNPKVF